MIIDENAKKRAWKIWELSQSETEYHDMLMETRILEKAYEDPLALLPRKEEDAVRDYVSQCEAMSWRMVQIACSMMRFADFWNE